jgi:predicted transglutaminase-like cysteine proteinase
VNTIDITSKANELLVKWSNGRDKAIADYHYYCGLIDGINQYISGLTAISSAVNHEIASMSSDKDVYGQEESRKEGQGDGYSYETRFERTEDSEAL